MKITLRDQEVLTHSYRSSDVFITYSEKYSLEKLKQSLESVQECGKRVPTIPTNLSILLQTSKIVERCLRLWDLGLRRLIKPNHTMKYNYSEVRLIFYCLLNFSVRFRIFFCDFTHCLFFQCMFHPESLYSK